MRGISGGILFAGVAWVGSLLLGLSWKYALLIAIVPLISGLSGVLTRLLYPAALLLLMFGIANLIFPSLMSNVTQIAVSLLPATDVSRQ